MDRQTRQRLDKALRTLRDVESRPWHDIVLSSPTGYDEVKEALKLLRIASAYTLFKRYYPESTRRQWREAYLVLRAAFDFAHFPERQVLTREQFGFLLDSHLDLLE